MKKMRDNFGAHYDFLVLDRGMNYKVGRKSIVQQPSCNMRDATVGDPGLRRIQHIDTAIVDTLHTIDISNFQ
jgi:hypothetical protein